MKQYIDKDAIVDEIEKRVSESLQHTFNQFYSGQITALNGVLNFLKTLEVKEVDLDESARHYLLHEHMSPLNVVLHQPDYFKVEMQYHKDIEDAYKAGFELGLKA